jgi:hypothetical protein
MTVCGNPLSRWLLGAKRTCPVALHMSANDPKRTLATADPNRDARALFRCVKFERYGALRWEEAMRRSEFLGFLDCALALAPRARSILPKPHVV